ncbi:SRPBCC family protein [Nocardioides sambongensis]|uniref:SRPBCC family protein n=1 Tax=Nocardioides sambongensis TaxID=2589074 RepID=UPI0011269FD7|nr:SRPBCC family protein [Nocardioides sambongensis]
MRASYRFTESWEVPGPPAAAAAILVDVERYPSWWPQVRAVARIDDDHARLLCRSTLPYTLDLVLERVCDDLPELEVALAGDLAGWVRWRLTETRSGGTRMELEQEVTVAGLLAAASWPARPVLRWNHHRMMAGCRSGLVARLSGPPPAAAR